jgi:hypothetical protein
MYKQLTAKTFIPWLVQEAHRVAQETIGYENAAAYVWAVAIEAIEWLHYAPEQERIQAQQALKECIETKGISAGITLPTDPHEAKCLTTLLVFVHNQPPLL